MGIDIEKMVLLLCGLMGIENIGFEENYAQI
jgi:hypothetical protein